MRLHIIVGTDHFHFAGLLTWQHNAQCQHARGEVKEKNEFVCAHLGSIELLDQASPTFSHLPLAACQKKMNAIDELLYTPDHTNCAAYEGKACLATASSYC